MCCVCALPQESPDIYFTAASKITWNVTLTVTVMITEIQVPVPISCLQHSCRCQSGTSVGTDTTTPFSVPQHPQPLGLARKTFSDNSNTSPAHQSLGELPELEHSQQLRHSRQSPALPPGVRVKDWSAKSPSTLTLLTECM